MFFFFFKQKTAYEMRISDWSSDVCSSDLRLQLHLSRLSPAAAAHQHAWRTGRRGLWLHHHAVEAGGGTEPRRKPHPSGGDPGRFLQDLPQRSLRQVQGARSEEHTSELQSLMRISYAVFCLKKKTK